MDIKFILRCFILTVLYFAIATCVLLVAQELIVLWSDTISSAVAGGRGVMALGLAFLPAMLIIGLLIWTLKE